VRRSKRARPVAGPKWRPAQRILELPFCVSRLAKALLPRQLLMSAFHPFQTLAAGFNLECAADIGATARICILYSARACYLSAEHVCDLWKR
jgi:hypothetical protein